MKDERQSWDNIDICRKRLADAKSELEDCRNALPPDEARARELEAKVDFETDLLRSLEYSQRRHRRR